MELELNWQTARTVCGSGGKAVFLLLNLVHPFWIIGACSAIPVAQWNRGCLRPLKPPSSSWAYS